MRQFSIFVSGVMQLSTIKIFCIVEFVIRTGVICSAYTQMRVIWCQHIVAVAGRIDPAIMSEYAVTNGSGMDVFSSRPK